MEEIKQLVYNYAKDNKDNKRTLWKIKKMERDPLQQI